MPQAQSPVDDPDMSGRGRRSSARYAAFVSYRHQPEDARWARWLVHRLETYRTPKPLVDLGYPARLGKLFRDDDEAAADSELEGQIFDALARSGCFVLVYSPRTAGSDWIERELREFTRVQSGAARIVPLVIEGDPQDARRYLASVLGDAVAATVGLGADLLRRDGEPASATHQRALLRIAAAMLRCEFDDLARRDEQRERSQRRERQTLAASLVILAGATALVGWDLTWRTRTRWYSQMEERWGVPQGRGQLSSTAASHRNESYRFTTRGGRVLEVARVDGSGRPSADPQFQHFEDPAAAGIARWVYRFYGDGLPAQIEQFDARGVLARRVSLQFLPDRSLAIARFEREFGVAQRDVANGGGVETIFRVEANSRSQVGQHRLRFDGEGRLLSRVFEPVGGGQPMRDARGTFGLSYTYDDQGRRVAIAAVDAKGQPLKGVPGQANLARAEWDGDEVKRVFWRDSEGRAAYSQGGVSEVRIERDTWGNMRQESFFDVEGRSIISSAWRYAIKRYAYDDAGRVIGTSLHDASGAPLLAYGFHREERRVSADGRQVEYRFFDPRGQLVPNRRLRCAIQREEFNERGWMVRQSCFDENQRPIPQLGSGSPVTLWRYDDQGRAVETRNLTAEGPPYGGKNGIARAERAYDGRGNLLSWNGFGVDGKPYPQSDSGFTGTRYAYDVNGNRIRSAGFGPNGQPAIHVSEGWSVFTEEFDDRGQVTTRRYFDPDGRPTLHGQQGASIRRFKYDESGQLASASGFGTQGEAVFEKNGCHRIEYQRDTAGRDLQRACFGPDGKPSTEREEGVHRIRFTYGSTGWTRREVFDSAGRPVASKEDGAAVVTRELDAAGRVLLSRYFGAGGEAVMSKDGEHVHAIQHAYDAAGNLVERRTLDVNMRLTPAEDDGAAIRRTRFDPAGNEIEVTYFDQDDRPIVEKQHGAHVLSNIYDTLGQLIGQAFFDADRRPMLTTDDGTHAFRSRLNERGFEVERRFEGIDGQPVLARDVAAARMEWDIDGLGNSLGERYFGVAGEPVREAESGAHSWKRIRDNLGRPLRLQTFDVDGSPLAERQSGVFESTRVWDAYGRVVEHRRFGTNGRPVAHREDGVAVWIYAYDARGNRALKLSFDARGRPVRARGAKCAASAVVYDARDEEVGQRCIDPLRALAALKR